MCYTGRCPYEHSSSGCAAGECSLKDGEPIPYDAACMLAERHLEEWELRHPLRVLAKELRYRLSRLWLELRWGFWPENQIPF